MRVDDIMTSPVLSVRPDTTIKAAVQLMLAQRISGLPVATAAGELVGIVSEGDFLRRSELGTEKKRARWLEFLLGPGRLADEYVVSHGRTVDEVMSRDPVTIVREASLREAVETMMRHQVKRLPVVEAGKLVGIVCRSDLMRALARELPADAATAANDAAIERAIVAELDRQTWSRNNMIRVTVKDGVAELSGTIFDERERKAARVAAENVAGVKAVKDDLVWVEPMSGMVVLPSEVHDHASSG